MKNNISQQDKAKILAGITAIDQFIHDGMKLGLGSGTTSHFFVRALGEKVKQGLQITATATSQSTIAVAKEVGIAITDINEIGTLDLTIDGPDEIDEQFRMIKGGGACLLWEKIVAHSSQKVIIICDETKRVSQLGKFPLPVEVVQFGWVQTQKMIEQMLTKFDVQQIKVKRREKGGQPVITDSGNFILDCHCLAIGNPEKLGTHLNTIPGVVENGLFNREADGVVVGMLDGTSTIKIRSSSGYDSF